MYKADNSTTKIEEIANVAYAKVEAGRDAFNGVIATQNKIGRDLQGMASQLLNTATFIENNAELLGEENANAALADIRRTLERAAAY